MNLLKKYLNTLSLCLSVHMSNPKASFFIFFYFSDNNVGKPTRPLAVLSP